MISRQSVWLVKGYLFNQLNYVRMNQLKAKVGDTELNAREYLGGKEEVFTYLFRQINKEWRIISHSGCSQTN